MAKESSAREISIREMGELLFETYLKDPKQNLGFVGDPGIGKTEIVCKNVFKKLKEVYPDFIDPNETTRILSQMDEVEFRMPWVTKDEEYRFLPNKDFIFKPDARAILFLDEAANATEGVRKAIQQALSQRRLGEIRFPDGIMFVICSNKKNNRAGAGSFNTAFANRVEWHTVRADPEDWLDDFAYPAGIDVTITSFIKRNPTMLNQFNPERDVNPTSRTWTKCNKVLDSQFRFDRLAGLLGEETATTFEVWRRLWTQFPEKQDVINKPEKAKLPESPDAQFALMCALVSWVQKKTWSSFYTYVSRFNLEYQLFFMKEAPRLNPKERFKETAEYGSWLEKHQKKII